MKKKKVTWRGGILGICKIVLFPFHTCWATHGEHLHGLANWVWFLNSIFERSDNERSRATFNFQKRKLEYNEVGIHLTGWIGSCCLRPFNKLQGGNKRNNRVCINCEATSQTGKKGQGGQNIGCVEEGHASIKARPIGCVWEAEKRASLRPNDWFSYCTDWFSDTKPLDAGPHFSVRAEGERCRLVITELSERSQWCHREWRLSSNYRRPRWLNSPCAGVCKVWLREWYVCVGASLVHEML